MNDAPSTSAAASRSLSGLREYLAVLVTLCVCAVVTYWRQLAQGQHLYWGDIGLYFTPMETFFRANLLSGRLPLWNPAINCGTPYIGNPQVWPLYPSAALLSLFTAGMYNSVNIALHTIFAGFGTYLLVRRTLSVGIFPALLAAITFSLGGQFVSKEQFPNMLQAMAWLPWIILLIHRAILSTRWVDAIWAGAAVGFQVLAAHAQITMLTLYLAAMYILFLFATSTHKSWKFAWQCVGLFGVALATAFCLAAGQLLPVLELIGNSERRHLEFEEVNRFKLAFDQLGNFVSPALHGHPFTGDFTARGNYWETCCFVGAIPAGFAILGLISIAFQPKGGKPGERWIRGFWAAIFVIGTVMALGGSGYLYRGAYEILPGFQSFHDPARCLLWSTFALSLASACGLAWIYKKMRPQMARIVAGAACVATFGVLAQFGQSIYPLTANEAPPAELPVVRAVLDDPLITAHQARFMAPDSDRVWSRFVSYHSYRRDLPHFEAFWADTLSPNLMISHDIYDAMGYEPASIQNSLDIIQMGSDAVRGPGVMDAPAGPAAWLGFLSVRYFVATRPLPPQNVMLDFAPVAVDPTINSLNPNEKGVARNHLSLNRLWQPRARLITDFQAVASLADAQGLLFYACRDRRVLDFAKTTLISPAVPFAPSPGPLQIAEVKEFGPDNVSIQANVSHPAVLVLADSIAPGWTATLDGAPSPILGANACLRAIAIASPGNHAVVFTYKPVAFLVGLYISLAMFSVLCGLLAFAAAGRVMNRRAAA